jgi:hypothetical protein
MSHTSVNCRADSKIPTQRLLPSGQCSASQGMSPRKRKRQSNPTQADGLVSRGIQRIPSSSKVHIHQHTLSGHHHSEDVFYLADDLRTQQESVFEPYRLYTGDDAEVDDLNGTDPVQGAEAQMVRCNGHMLRTIRY